MLSAMIFFMPHVAYVLFSLILVHKRMSGTSSNTSAAQSAIRPDARAEVLAEQPELATNFIKYESIQYIFPFSHSLFLFRF